MAPNGNGSSAEFVVVGNTGGVTVVDPSTPLKRLNYFDGKFLRASDFEIEQRYLRGLVAISNQGLGAGVVYGYDTTLGGGDLIQIGPGLAIDPSGHVLLLQSTVTQSIQTLIDATKKLAIQQPDASGKIGSDAFHDCVEIAAPPPTVVVPVSDIYVIAICAAEALCGQQDVYGKLCEEACVTSTERPYRLEGVVLRAIPLQILTPFPTSKAVAIDSNIYLRSKVAHSWYGDEVRKHPDAVFRDGLLSHTWCLGAGYNSACCEVPLAVVARAGATTVFLDTWIVRRERIDAPAKRYWQWKMRMRPWDVFLAQVLQFQCQLADLLSGVVTPGSRAVDPCAPHHEALNDAVKFVEQVRLGLAHDRSDPRGVVGADRPTLLSLSLTGITDLRDRIRRVIATDLTPARPTDRILIRGGIIELPSAGYLPVLTGTAKSVNDQVRALLGDGLDLRFCTTTADYIAHAVEEAQHMDRISLLQGLDDPSDKPKVDILVPDGKPTTITTPTAGLFSADVLFSAQQTGGLIYKGAAREDMLDSGGLALYAAAAGVSQGTIGKLQTLAKSLVAGGAGARPLEFNGDLSTNTFIRDPKTTGTRLDELVMNTATAARDFISRTGSVAGPVGLAGETVISTGNGADGLWLTARADREIKSLVLNAQTPVHLRIVLGTQSTSPLAFEIMFHGTFLVTSVSSAAGGPGVSGTLNGTLSIGIYRENQNPPQTIEYLMTERFNWPARFSYTGDESNGLITLDVTTAPGPFGPLRLGRAVMANGAKVQYAGDIIGQTGTRLGELDLVADANVVNVANASHRYAESGLDIVQGALVVSEPGFKQSADAQLFPALPPVANELRIDAVRDWVMFTRRRHKQCALDVVPVPPLPPRGYRVINLRAVNAEQLKNMLDAIATPLKDPAQAAAVIRRLIIQDDRAGNNLIARFAGGRATPVDDVGAAQAWKSDWEHFQTPPGKTIVFSAIGAVGESDATLQGNRLNTFENAIRDDSQESGTTDRVMIVPYPESVVPPDADGVMVFITVSPAPAIVEKQHVFGANTDLFQSIRRMALNPQATADQLMEVLKRGTDFKNATYTVDAGGTATVSDDDVLRAFSAHSGHIEQGIVLFNRSLSAADAAIVGKVGQKVIGDLHGPAVPAALPVAGGFPLTDAKSILLLQVIPIG